MVRLQRVCSKLPMDFILMHDVSKKPRYVYSFVYAHRAPCIFHAQGGPYRSIEQCTTESGVKDRRVRIAYQAMGRARTTSVVSHGFELPGRHAYHSRKHFGVSARMPEARHKFGARH